MKRFFLLMLVACLYVVTNAQNLVRQRVRISNYHNEIMSKLGISAVGNVNAAFYGATQAAKNFYGNMKSRRRINFIKSILRELRGI